MNPPVLTSTFFLTLLLGVGLFFFIRASVKERVERIEIVADESAEAFSGFLRQHFTKRGYRVAEIVGDRVDFEGYVRPSWFLAILLTAIAAIGLSCLSLILATLVPQFSGALWAAALVAPLAGVFYWRGAGRTERVSLQIQSPSEGTARVTATGHRDELAVLQRQVREREVGGGEQGAGGGERGAGGGE